MKRLIAIILALGAFLNSYAQKFGVDKLYLDMRAAFHQEFTDGKYDSQLIGEHLNFNIMGHITPTVDYRIRQRLNKKVFDERNMFNATDFMYINWQATPNWSITVGKQAVLIGGYEYDAAPIDVYYYSMFCNNLYQGFTFAAAVTYTFAEHQNIIAQVCNSPLSLGFQSVYAYNLAWMGQVMPWWKTIWSVNFVEDIDKKMINYIALGNHFQFGDLLFDVDVMNRASFGQRRFLFTDMSLIVKMIYSIGKWNICAKGGYEFNLAENVDSSGRPYDAVVPPGTKYWYAGCGLEFFPLGGDNLRLHLVYYRDNLINRNNIELGVTWRLGLF